MIGIGGRDVFYGVGKGFLPDKMVVELIPTDHEGNMLMDI